MAPLTSQPTPIALWGVLWGAGDPSCTPVLLPLAQQLMLRWPLLRIYHAIHRCYQNCVLSDAVHGLLVPSIVLPWANCQCQSTCQSTAAEN